jgi:hypothetical protein
VFIAGILQESHAPKTHVARFADDDVIEKGNVEELASVTKLPGYGDVLWTRRWIAAGVVMGDDDADGSVLNRFTEDFSSSNKGRVCGANVDVGAADELVLGIEEQGHEELALLVSNVGEKLGNGVGIGELADFALPCFYHSATKLYEGLDAQDLKWL